MENELLIHEFLDGVLDTAGEERFFSMLAGNAELQTELKQQLAIKTAVRSDVKAFTPKAESTLRIFNELNLAMPAAAVVSAPSTAFLSKMAQFMKLQSGAVISSLLSAGVTALLILGMFNPGSEGGNTNSEAGAFKNPVPKAPAPVSESYAADNEKESLKEEIARLRKNAGNKIVYKYIYVKNSSSAVEADAPQNQISRIADVELSTPVLQNRIYNAQSSLNDGLTYNEGLSIDQGYFFIPGVLTDESGYKGITLEFRGSAYQLDRQPRINANDNMAFMNSAFAFMYDATDEIKIGADYRRENFYQRFGGEENGSYYIYDQQPNFETLSLFVKFAPEKLRYYMVKPYLYSSLGGNAAGPVGRMMIGADIQVIKGFYLGLGADYSMLIYSQKNERFFSTKSGLHFGAGYNF